MHKDVTNYIQAIDSDERKSDVQILVDCIAKTSPDTPAMWGTSIISFGLYHYTYNSGRQGDAPKIGLSSRKQAIVVYGLHISEDNHPNQALLAKLGKYKTGKGCLYISKLSDINLTTLQKMVHNVVAQ